MSAQRELQGADSTGIGVLVGQLLSVLSRSSASPCLILSVSLLQETGLIAMIVMGGRWPVVLAWALQMFGSGVGRRGTEGADGAAPRITMFLLAVEAFV